MSGTVARGVAGDQRPNEAPSKARVSPVKRYADPCKVSSDGLQGGGEVVQGLGQCCVLRGRKRREPEAAAGHEVGFAPELPLPPDDGAPDDLSREGIRLPRRREFEGTGRPEPKPGEVLELGSRDTPRHLGEGGVRHRPLCAHSLQPQGEGRGGPGCLNPPTPP